MNIRFVPNLIILPVLFSLATVARALDISVPVYGDIQAAMDKVAASGGGAVNLAAGTYTLTSPLLIRSKVHLSGQGPDSTTIAGGDFTIIKQADEGLQEIVIEKLKVVGQLTKNCYGILIEANQIAHEDVAIRNVEVTHCGMGVHIKRARDVLIEQSDIHGNGATGMEGYFHNLYIRSCEKVRVADCTLNQGLTGNGLNVSFSKEVVVVGTAATDNYFRGIRAADTDGFAVIDCTIVNNGDIGLIANQEKGHVTTGIDWQKNTITGNRQGGMKAAKGAKGQVRINTVKDNLKFNYSLPDDLN